MIDILSSMSFADDYEEVHIQRFEQALMSGGNLSYDLSGFTQFVFDNADFNVATLTEHNTFHSMGGIACATPPGSVNNSPIKREVKLQYSANSHKDVQQTSWSRSAVCNNTTPQ